MLDIELSWFQSCSGVKSCLAVAIIFKVSIRVLVDLVVFFLLGAFFIDLQLLCYVIHYVLTLGHISVDS